MEKDKKINTITLVNIILIIAILIGDLCYIYFGAQPINKYIKLLIKGITSLGFVVLGLVNLIYAIKNQTQNKKFSIFMLVGLFFAMCGDIVLNLVFEIGAVLFAVGHVFYFISYSFLLKPKWKDLIFGAIIFVPAVLFITLAPIFNFGGLFMELICVIYAIIISLMVGKAISNFIQVKSLLNLILVVGSCLFFFSDLMLLLNVFAKLPKIIDVLCLATYYPAQCLLAYSITILTKEDSNKENTNKESVNKEEVINKVENINKENVITTEKIINKDNTNKKNTNKKISK